MELKYNDSQRKEYFKNTQRIGRLWLRVFEGNEEFYSSAYWDLLTNIWMKDGPVRKTDALRFMTNIKSAHTAGKYVETAIASGILIEEDNPADARSKPCRNHATSEPYTAARVSARRPASRARKSRRFNSSRSSPAPRAVGSSATS